MRKTVACPEGPETRKHPYELRSWEYYFHVAKGPTKQHYVPRCYLAGWVDPSTPAGQEPYVWVFNRGERKGRKKAPSNLFTETDLYTLKLRILPIMNTHSARS